MYCYALHFRCIIKWINNQPLPAVPGRVGVGIRLVGVILALLNVDDDLIMEGGRIPDGLAAMFSAWAKKGK